MVFRGRTVAILLILTIILSSSATFLLVEQPSLSSGDFPEELRIVAEAYKKIKSDYVEEKTEKELIDGAILGMVQALDDPHSTYMDAEEAKEFFSSLKDSFEGIGAEVTMENGRVTIIAPIKGSPSEKAGLKPRDQIIKVNGESLEGLSLYEAVNKIRGPKGTKAELEIVRPGITETITITVIRDEIPIQTVHSSTISTRKGLIGKIEITNFGEKTATEFKKALTELENQKIKGLIIDLRGNPGGYLQSVVEIGNLLVPNKGIIVQIEDKYKNRKKYNSKLDEAKYPIVTLINGGSASASEILASALQEAGNYPIVGETSFGKGTVQNVFEMTDGSNIKLTIAKWLTPNGNWIHKKGVVPNVKVTQPDYFNATPFPQDVNLKLDMNGNDVKNLQLILDGLGYNPSRNDGYFDKGTESAVKAFQKVNGLEVTGVVDSKTAMMLQETLVKRIKDPKADVQLQVSIETLLKLIQ
ncbi:peptidase S41 [Vulcanibacillus modesticaldus]|uniref:Peptidase S41 n=1 Tax=Vulcanibacillus modesticaldus TaxID=337097 RepID=A0A1D2YWT5_9BACI|nr:S41 family peptidase [Vulcanibacillus modesticaldus]OEG00128.1 peptidase S41 [Vulcanibacillus modesticaldus]